MSTSKQKRLEHCASAELTCTRRVHGGWCAPVATTICAATTPQATPSATPTPPTPSLTPSLVFYPVRSVEKTTECNRFTSSTACANALSNIGQSDLFFWRLRPEWCTGLHTATVLNVKISSNRVPQKFTLSDGSLHDGRATSARFAPCKLLQVL